MTMPEEPMPLGENFSFGYDSGRGGLSPSLAAQGARWTEMGAAAAQAPQSVLHQLSPSPIAANLSAPNQQSRLLRNGIVLPNTSNGASGTTAESDQYLRMMNEAI